MSAPLRIAAMLVMLVPCGCDFVRSRAGARSDSSSVLLGQFKGESLVCFVGDGPVPSPFKDAPVYLVPVTPQSTMWWRSLAFPSRAREPLREMVLDTSTSDAGGRFKFLHVRAGEYYLYSPVPQHSMPPLYEGMESDSVARKTWLGSVRVPSRDTAGVLLRCLRSVGFPLDSILQFDRAALELRLDEVLRSEGCAPLGVNDSSSGCLAGWFDLNGDEQLDAVVLLRPRLDGSWGRSLLVFEQRSDSLVFVSRTTGVQDPVTAAPSTTGGWHDLFVVRPGKGGYPVQPSRHVRLRFDHAGYPPDASGAEVVDWQEPALNASLPLIPGW